MSGFIGPKPDSGNLSHALLPDDDSEEYDRYDAAEDEIDVYRRRVRALHEQLEKLQSTDAQQRIAELEEALAMATGPHCSTCGNAIDPEHCHCGEHYDSHSNWSDGHGFVPMGCVCGYIGRDSAAWAGIASNLRENLWRAKRRAIAATDTIERARVIVQHWRSKVTPTIGGLLFDALGVALDAYDREPNDG